MLRKLPISFFNTLRKSTTFMPVMIRSTPNTVRLGRMFSNESNKLLKLIEAVEKNDNKTVVKFAEAESKLTRKTNSLVLQQTHDDNTPFHQAAKDGNVAMMKTLVENFPVEVNLQCHCEKRRTALHYAVQGNHSTAVEFLFGLGANPNIQDEHKRTAMDYALENNNAKLAALIAQHGGTPNLNKNSSLIPRVHATLYAKKYENKNSVSENFSQFITNLKSPKK